MLPFCNTEQFQCFFQEVNLVVAIVFLKPLGSQPVQARIAPVMLWA